MPSKQLMIKLAEAAGALCVMLVLILWMSGACTDKIEPGVVEGRAALVPEDARTAVAEEATVPVVEEAAGTVQAERKTVVSSRITALIRQVLVRAGDVVATGDPLIRLDDRDLTSRLEEARRAVEAAAAERARTERNLSRAKSLLQQGVVSQGEYDQAEAAFKVADAELARAQQGLQGADVALSFTILRAPVDGRIVDRLADSGDMALPGKPLLSLYDPSALRIEVQVRESLVSGLTTRQSLRVRLAVVDEVIEGTVDEIVPQAEAGSRTFLVKIGLPKRAGVYTGMFGRVEIPAGERRRTLIPSSAVERVGQLAFVQVVQADRRSARRLVTLGPTTEDDRVEVLSGVRTGEALLLERR
jgi:RND family efflux transporter MFP subunit